MTTMSPEQVSKYENTAGIINRFTRLGAIHDVRLQVHFILKFFATCGDVLLSMLASPLDVYVAYCAFSFSPNLHPLPLLLDFCVSAFSAQLATTANAIDATIV